MPFLSPHALFDIYLTCNAWFNSGFDRAETQKLLAYLASAEAGMRKVPNIRQF